MAWQRLAGPAAEQGRPGCISRSDGNGGGMLKDWQHWIGTFTGVVLITVAVLPLAALAVWALANRRTCHRRHAGVGVADVAGRGRHRLRDGAVDMDDHAAGRPVRGEPGTAAGSARHPHRRGPVELTGQIVGNLLVFAALGFFAPLRFAATGVGTPDPGARGGLLGPDRDRAVRPTAGPGVLCGRRTAQHRRRRTGRAGVAPLVARQGQSAVRPTPIGRGTWMLSRPRYADQRPRAGQEGGQCRRPG